MTNKTPPLDIGWLDALAERSNHKIKPYGFLPEDVLWGELHMDMDCIKAQLEFIGKYRPEIVMHEFFDTRVFDPETERISFRRRAPRNRQDEPSIITPPIYALMLASNSYMFKIVGCDLTFAEKEQKLKEKLNRSAMYREWGGGRVKAILYELGIEYNDSPTLECAIGPERNKEIADTYKAFRNQTNRPILVIAGREHYDDKSSIHTELEGLPYCVMSTKKACNFARGTAAGGRLQQFIGAIDTL